MEDNIEQPQVEVPQQETPKTGDLDKLYAVVNQAGLYTKSKDEFIKKYSTPENIDKLHTVVSQAGLYTKSKDDFYSKYYPDLTKQTTEPQQPLVTAPKQQPVTTQDLSFKNLTKTLPTGGAVPKKEGSWKNIVQNVAANVELAGTKLASGTANIVRDISNKIIKEPELFDKEGKLTKEAANISWTSDPLGKIIVGLNGNKQRMEGVIENNQLPNTFLGNVAQSASELFPDLAATAALPETKVPELAGAMSKTIATLGNTFTKYLATKGALTGYEEAKSHGQSMVEASKQGFKGLLKGAETGVEMAALGVGSNSATNSVMKLGEKVGLTGAKGVGAKELVNLATDVAAYGLISPYSHSVIEGTPLTAHDIANGAGIAAAFRIKGTAETLGKHYELNRVLKETQDLRQGVALSNFSDATPESIHEVYKMPESAEELNLKALQFTKEAKATTDLEKKQNLVAKAIMYTKASNVKGITEQIVNNPSSLEEVANSTDIPDNLKKPFLEKATQVSELINQPKEVAQEQPKIETQPTETIPNEQGQEQTPEIQQPTEVEKPITEKVSEVVGEPKEGETYKGVFNPKKTGLSGLDDLLEDDGYNFFYKGVQGKVEMMSPDEYLNRVRKGFKEDKDVNVTEDKKDAIKKAIEKGDKINMPFLSTKDGKFSQEGRNRAVVAKELGEKEIPVMVESDVTFDDKIKRAEEIVAKSIDNGNTTKEEILADIKKSGLHRDGVSFIDNNFDEIPKPKEKTTPTIKEEVGGNEYYHGTSLPKSESDFTSPDKDKGVGVRSNAFMGTSREQKSPFFFITSERDVANDFANAKADYINEKVNAKEKHTPRIIPFKFDEKKSKVLDLTKDNYEQNLNELGFDPIEDYGIGMYDESMMWEYLDNPKFAEKLKEEGYDAVKYVEPKRGVGIAILNTDKIVNSKSKSTPKEEVKGETKTETPKVEEKTYANKDLERAKAKEVHAKVRAMDEPTKDPKQIALKYLADGNKVGQEAINEIEGTVKRARLNTGERELKSAEAKARDYTAQTKDLKEAESKGWDLNSLDNIAEKLSEKHDVDVMEMKDALMKAIGEHNTRLEAGQSYLERYNSDYAEEQHYAQLIEERQSEFDKELKDINDWLTSEGEKTHPIEAEEEHINNLIEQYETEFKAENQQPTSESEGNVSKETSTGTSTKENGKENTKLETPKTEQNVQEPSTGSVLQHPQEGIREQRGQSGRMESSIEGEKPSKESGNGGGANTTDKNKDGGNEEGLTGITHAETDKVARELGLPEYEKNPETVEEWDIEADRKIKEEKNAIPKLLDKLKEGKMPSEVEQRMMLKYLASLKAKINADPLNDKLINEYKEGKELSDVIGGREVAKSLVARKGLTPTEDSIGDLMVRQMEVLGVDKLTEKQKEDVIKNFEEVNKAKEEAEAKIKILADENAKLRALFEFNKTKSTTQRKSKQEITKERETIKQSIKDKWKKASNDNTLTAVPLPYAKQLSAIAPDVAKLMRSYVEEGATSLNDVVKKIIDDVKEFIPEITDKDVNAIIAGEYNEKKQTRNEITAKLVDLRNEARLIGKYEELENGVEPISEKKKTEKNQQLAELRKQIKEHDLTKLANIKKQIASRIEKEEEKIKNKDFAPEVKKVSLLDNPELKKRFPKQYKEAQDARDRLNKLKIEREVAFLKQQYANRSGKEKVKDAALEVLNLPRTIMSSMDFSAPLRQGVIPTVTHPFVAAKAFKTMFQHAFNQKAFDRWFMDLRESDAYKVMEKSGLYVADPHDLRLTAKEESFMNNLAEKIPFGIGTAIKGSERAYVSYLNKMRVDLFRQGADAFLADGKTPENSPELYKGLASWVNNSTGRGGIGKLENASPILSAAFFSPRLIAARLNALNPVYYAKLPKEVRVAAVTDMIKFIALGATALTIAHINGASVQLDPRSSDFGKIKVGDTRYDIWGGFGQYIRVLTQLITAQSKSAQSGKIQDLSGKGAFGKTRASVAIGFVRGKLAPVPATTWDFLSGRTAVGEKVSVKDEVISHFTPLIYSDVKDAFKQQGVKALFTVGLPSTFGVGVQTYLPKDKKTTQKSIAR